MKTTASLDAALAMLANSYHVEPLPDAAEKIVVVLPSKEAKPKKEKKGKKSAKSESAAPKTLASGVLPINMPVVGSLNATQFLLALRDCGKRVKEDTNLVTGEVTMRPIFDGSLVREDSIKAIHAFIGYDAALNFGEQDVAARAEAQRQIRGNVIPAQYHRRGGASVAPTVQGYIAGAPDNLAKRKADLEGRERQAVNERLRHEKNAMDPNFIAPTGEAAPAVMAALEEERLVAIQKDLDSL